MDVPPGTRLQAVVVIAHGPAKRTARQCGLLRKALPNAVRRIVAGTEPGLAATRAAARAGFDAVDGHGPEALLTAIERLPHGPILVVHDDVEIASADLDLLVKTFESTGILTIPGNDDAFEKRPTAAEIVCAVGGAEQLIEVARQAGFSPGRVTKTMLIAPARTSAPHDGACRSRLMPVVPSEGRPLLVAGIIMRDEADQIGDCLDALEGVVDRIEIADSGSIDSSVDIAIAAGANVVQIPWNDDFAQARNVVLDRCRDAHFMLWVDADERLHVPDPARFRQTLHTLRAHYSAFRLPIHNIDAAGETTTKIAIPRIARTDDLEFTGAIHERAVRRDGEPLVEIALDGCRIDHVGYQRDVVDARSKAERNVRAAEVAYQADPSDAARAHYYRALARGGAGGHDASESLRMMDDLIADTSIYDAPLEALMLTLRANVCLEIGDDEEAVATAERGAQLVPSDPGVGAVLAEALVRLGKHREAIDSVEALADRTSPDPVFSGNQQAEQHRAWAVFRSHLALGDLPQALAMVDALPSREDPWATILQSDCVGEAPAIPNMAAVRTVAAAAGALNDARFTDALLHAATPASTLRLCLTAFVDSGGSEAGVARLRRTIDRRANLERAPMLRDQFVATQATADAVAYVEAVVDEFGDLRHAMTQMKDDRPDRQRVAEALALAAEGWARRENHTGALTDAIAALELWPGAIRAGIVAASGAVASGMPEVALDIVAAVSSAKEYEDAPRTYRHELTNTGVFAHLCVGSLAAAADDAAMLLRDGGRLDCWQELISATHDDIECFAVTVSLALMGDGDAFVQAAQTVLEPVAVATTCLTYLEGGGDADQAVTTGLVAASVAGRDDLADLLLAHRSLVDDTTLENLGGLLRAEGHEVVAARLSAARA